MTPRGHCFFCGDLAEHAVGKIPICEYCGHDLLDFLQKSQKEIHRQEAIDDDEMNDGAGGY